MSLRSIATAALLALTTFVGTATVASAQIPPEPSGPSRATLYAAAKAVEFEVVHGSNYGHYKRLYPSQLNWSHDGCSVPKAILAYPGLGAVIGHYSGVFNDSCNRHDFGYRNFGKAKNSPGPKFSPTRATKDAIDNRFESNMKIECKQAYGSVWEVPARELCYGAADLFYEAVHHFGDGSFFG